MLSTVRLVAALAAAFIAFAPAAVDAREIHHVANVDGSLFIGIGVAEDHGNRAVAVYVCDGSDVSRWLFGLASTDHAAFENEDLSVSLDFTGDTLNGAVTFAGAEPAAFVAERASESAGVYRPHAYAGGWIILNNMDQRGAVAFRGETVHPELDPEVGSANVRGTAITAQRELGLADCFSEPSDRCPLPQ